MARGIKELVLNDRDRFVLFLLDKFRVLDVKSLTVLAGFSSVNYADIRLWPPPSGPPAAGLNPGPFRPAAGFRPPPGPRR